MGLETSQREPVFEDASITCWFIDHRGVFVSGQGEALRRLVPHHAHLAGESTDNIFSHLPEVAEDCRRALAGQNVSVVVCPSRGNFLQICHRPVRNTEGQVIGVQGVAIDISPWRQMAHELHCKQQCVERLIEAAPAAVLMLDAEGRVVRCNPYLLNLIGYSMNGLVGQDWFGLTRPEPRRSLDRATYRNALNRRGVYPLVVTITAKNGESHQIEWSHWTLFDAEGAPLGALAVGEDITARQEAQARAVQIERLAAIGEMVTGLAHESGNALQRIQACLEMLTFQLHDQPAALDLLHRLQTAQDYLLQLYEEVRQYAAPIVLRREPVHMNDILCEAWEHLEPIRAHRKARLVNHASTRYVCRVDRYAVERVFRNILENSLAAAADPVLIEVLWSDKFLDKLAAVEVRLRDNGPGLNPEQRKRIFEPFFTTKAQSTGLGMAISKRLVEAHGGRITIGDGNVPGAEIVVTLPKE